MTFKSNIPTVVQQIKKDITEDVQRAAAAGFEASQRQVKVVTGHLKNSGGYGVFDENGRQIGGSRDVTSPGATGSITGVISYDADYAATVASRDHSESDHFLNTGFADANDSLTSQLSKTKT